jgi:hypothetical protein
LNNIKIREVQKNRFFFSCWFERGDQIIEIKLELVFCLFLARLASVLTLTSALSLLLGEELLDAVVACGELLGLELLVRLLELVEGFTVEGDVFLLVLSGEDLTRDVGALTLGDTELVALEFGGVGEGLLGSDGLGLASLGPAVEDLLLGEGFLDGLGGGVDGNTSDGDLGGLDVLDGLDMAPHVLLFGIFDEDAVGVDDGSDDTDLVSAGTAEDADEATDLDVGLVDHCC